MFDPTPGTAPEKTTVPDSGTQINTTSFEQQVQRRYHGSLRLTPASHDLADLCNTFEYNATWNQVMNGDRAAIRQP